MRANLSRVSPQHNFLNTLRILCNIPIYCFVSFWPAGTNFCIKLKMTDDTFRDVHTLCYRNVNGLIYKHAPSMDIISFIVIYKTKKYGDTLHTHIVEMKWNEFKWLFHLKYRIGNMNKRYESSSYFMYVYLASRFVVGLLNFLINFVPALFDCGPLSIHSLLRMLSDFRNEIAWNWNSNWTYKAMAIYNVRRMKSEHLQRKGCLIPIAFNLTVEINSVRFIFRFHRAFTKCKYPNGRVIALMSQ